jgi:hypothetical protein
LLIFSIEKRGVSKVVEINWPYFTEFQALSLNLLLI